jgi:AcrR family transcriptional regulator
MSLNDGNVPQRRRGQALEAALLDAAWDELDERGYDGFTIDGAAARAATSRAVIYRRWPGKPELVRAAIEHEVAKDAVVAPDTGSLRNDVIAMLQQANQRRFQLATRLFSRLGELYEATGTSLHDLAEAGLENRQSLMDQMIARAIARGELDADRVTARIARLPGDLFRYELLATMQPVSDETIEEIVDTIFLPLVRGS